MTGTIQAHRGRGRALGYPTINLALTQPMPHGVYAGYVWLKQRRYPAAIFVGAAITFNEAEVQIEAHILEPILPSVQPSLHRRVTIECLTFLRANKKFVTPQALQRQIAADIMNVQICLQALSKKSSR